ncbi:hypothetical protein ACFQ9X_47515 [Catenulispora yoronensis]
MASGSKVASAVAANGLAGSGGAPGEAVGGGAASGAAASGSLASASKVASGGVAGSTVTSAVARSSIVASGVAANSLAGSGGAPGEAAGGVVVSGGVVASAGGAASGGEAVLRPRNPWRDPGYLLFVLLDIFMNLDDAVLMVGLPLWAVTRTEAPHAVVPAVLVINTLMVVFLQMPVSTRVVGTRAAAGAVAWYGVALLGGCALIAVSASGGAVFAGVMLLGAAVVVTIAELVRSLASWELAVALAPGEAQASYIGVAGMAQAIERSAGPVALSSAVMAAGPVGWLGLGAVVTGLGVVQRVASLRRLDAMA